MHNFVYLAQRRSQEFSCEPNFFWGGACPRHPPGCATGQKFSESKFLSITLRMCSGKTVLDLQARGQLEDKLCWLWFRRRKGMRLAFRTTVTLLQLIRRQFLVYHATL